MKRGAHLSPPPGTSVVAATVKAAAAKSAMKKDSAAHTFGVLSKTIKPKIQSRKRTNSWGKWRNAKLLGQVPRIELAKRRQDEASADSPNCLRVGFFESGTRLRGRMGKRNKIEDKSATWPRIGGPTRISNNRGMRIYIWAEARNS